MSIYIYRRCEERVAKKRLIYIYKWNLRGRHTAGCCRNEHEAHALAVLRNRYLQATQTRCTVPFFFGVYSTSEVEELSLKHNVSLVHCISN